MSNRSILTRPNPTRAGNNFIQPRPALLRAGVVALMFGGLLLAAFSGTALPARAAGTVWVEGDGTPASCIGSGNFFAVYNQTQAGDLMTFNCGPNPVVIDISDTGTIPFDISRDGLTIDGGSLITLSGGNLVTVFNIASGTLNLRHLTISNGNSGNQGGGIQNNGTLNVTDTTFSNNSGEAGAIYNRDSSTANIINSTFSGNTGNDGGAIRNGVEGGAVLTITNSTFSGNTSATDGGAISNDGGDLTVTNSTFNANTATGQGSAIANFSFVTSVNIASSTFLNNISPNNVLYAFGGADANINLTNSIVTNPGGSVNCVGTVNDNGGNFSSDNTCGLLAGGNTDALAGAGGLASNGGPTQTIALPAGSPAINSGVAGCPALDQRYAARNGNCDSGAYESNGALPAAPTVSISFNLPAIALGGISTMTINLSNPNGGLTFTGAYLKVPMPSQIQVAPGANPATTCTPNKAGVAGLSMAAPNTLLISGYDIPAGGSCAVTLNVTSNVEGAWMVTSEPLTVNEYGKAGTGSGTLVVGDKPVVSKSFSPASITTGSTSALQLRVINPSATKSFTNLSFTDNLPAGLTIATPSGLSNNCGGTVTAASGSAVINVSGINLAAGQNCVISVNVTGKQPGRYTNIVASLSTTETGSYPNLVPGATLTIIAPNTGQPAEFVLQLRVSPDHYASTDGENLIKFKFKLKNIGKGQARFVHLQLPIETGLIVGFTEFKDLRIWVSNIVLNVEHPYVVVDFPVMGSDEETEGTLVFRPGPNAKPGAMLFLRAFLFWDDDTGAGKPAGSNAVRLFFSTDQTNRNDSDGAVQLLSGAPTTATNGQIFSITGDFFAPGEVVSFWYTSKAGQSISLGTAQADGQGRVSFSFTPKDLPPGESYVLAGFGYRSEVKGSFVFTVASS